MTAQLSFKQRLIIATMLFGLFFGAGNIIFPVYLGQVLASDIVPAIIGFIITAVGIPLLATAAIGYSNSESVFQLARHVSPGFAYFFTITLYLTIGPLFAIPRLATVSFEVGFTHFISPDSQTISLAIYSALFFIMTLFFSLRPSKIIDTVGKYLTPIFLIMISVIIVMGLVDSTPITNQPSATANGLATGFLQGYNTMDGLAGLAFGIIITRAIQSYRVTQPAAIAKEILISGTLSALMMAIIYIGLILIGRQSLAFMPVSANGGVALAQITQHYLGFIGQVLLAIMMVIACLKTAIGLVVALSETFSDLFKRTSQQFWAIVACLVAFLIANLGLDTIVQLSVPVLLFIYPLAIVLIIFSFMENNYQTKFIAKTTLLFTGLAALVDALKAAPSFIKNNGIAVNIIDIADTYLPGFENGLGWSLPAIIGFLLGWLIVKLKMTKQ